VVFLVVRGEGQEPRVQLLDYYRVSISRIPEKLLWTMINLGSLLFGK
jgi:hypothetical protein